MADIDGSVWSNPGKSIEDRQSRIGRSGEELEDAQFSAVEINAIGKGAASINRRAQNAVLSYRSMTASEVRSTAFQNCKATGKQKPERNLPSVCC
jgi:hypothetical protein